MTQRKQTGELFSACLTAMEMVSHTNPRMQLLSMESPWLLSIFFPANVLKMKNAPLQVSEAAGGCEDEKLQRGGGQA